MRFAREGWVFVGGGAALFLFPALACMALGYRTAAGILLATALAAAGGILLFFRDPERRVEAGPGDVLSGADGVVRSIEEMDERDYLNTRVVRISVFLSIFDVHVNRSPVTGRVAAIQYTPGKHLFAFLDAASEYNEHSSILIEGEETRCLVRQIVGPVARRVVCWLSAGQCVGRGERLGIMKFGSRLDVHLPFEGTTVLVKKGDRVGAGRSVIAKVGRKTGI